MAALFLCLLGCSKGSTKPDLQPWAIPDTPLAPGQVARPEFKPEPPRLDCRQPKPAASSLPQHPRTGDDVAWSIWAARVYGYVRQWYAKDDAEISCEKKLRDKGVFR
jgi:hypothetical protein